MGSLRLGVVLHGVIPAFREVAGFKYISGYIASLRSAWATGGPAAKEEKERTLDTQVEITRQVNV